MIITTSMMGLKGLVTPELDDNQLRVPPLALITLPLRQPLSLPTAPPPTPGAEDSFAIYADSGLIGASQAVSSQSMGFLSPGLWHLHLEYWETQSYGLTAANANALGVRIKAASNPLAIQLLSRPGTNAAFSEVGKCDLTLNLREICEIIMVTPGTGVGESAHCFASMVASRLQ